MKYSVRVLGKVAVATLTGMGLCIQHVYSETKPPVIPSVNDVTTRLPGWEWDHNWDNRNPVYRVLAKNAQNNSLSQKEKVEMADEMTPTAYRNLILIRHGQYNEKGNCDKERGLTALGRRQAEATGKRLKSLVKNYDRFIVSDMTRALETAEIIGNELLPRSSKSRVDQIFECDPLLKEGSPIEPIPATRKHRELDYYTDSTRIEAAFRKYFHRADPEQEAESYEILVCHANVIRYFCCRALQFPGERWMRMSLANGSITHIRIYENGIAVLMSFGDNGHMPKELLTTR